jgi:magnesium-protoporphyrin IX monomethyl ester (oxidative) cyclase
MVAASGPRKRLVIVNPPALPGRTNDRALSGGVGVSRKLKPLEVEPPQVVPLDLLYMAACAERAGAEAVLLDLLLERLTGEAALRFCAGRVGDGQGAWVGVRLSMPSLLADLAFAGRLKERLPGCTVFVFGTVILSTLEHWIGRCAVDYVFFGEPEALVEPALAAEDPRSVPGLLSPRTYQPLTGDDLFDPAKNEARRGGWAQTGALSTLPRPAWHLLDLPRYSPTGRTEDVGVMLQASRGCPIGCSMCPYVLVEGRPWRKHEIDQVVDEVDHLNQTWGIHRVRFRDANFGFNRQYARALAEALVARGVKLSASVETSVEMLDEETLRALARAGINTITTGVETNDEAVMNSIGQKLKVNAKITERIALCHQIGFHVYGTYCLGFPEETFETVEKTWRFANALDVESGFTVLTPFPGTPMYWRALEEGLLPKRMQFEEWNSYSATVRTYTLTARDLEMVRWWARMETILPFRRKRAAARGAGALLGFYLRHLPHYAWRQACRAYVGLRKRWPGPPLRAAAGADCTDAPAPVAATANAAP